MPSTNALNRASINVLLVEDDAADFEFLQHCLLDHGHPQLQLTRAIRLSDALARLQEQPFHLIITDLNLPDTEGLPTFFKLKEASPESAVIVLTGLEDGGRGAAALRAGAQDYLVKGDLSPARVWQCARNAMMRQGILRRVSSSVKELHEANGRLQTLSSSDPLTGLYNRRGFDERLAQGAGQAKDGPGNSVLLVDLDDFKQVNDRLGHDQGDLALLEVARRLQSHLRPADFAARVGGDEFMVLLPGTSIDNAKEVAERIRAAVDGQPVPSAAKPFHVTVSVGVAHQPPELSSTHELLARTHRAMTLSKLGGKNRVSFDESGSGELLFPAPGSARILKRGFFRISDGKIAGWELLCRSLPKPGAALPEGPARARAAVLPKTMEGFGLCVLAAAEMPAEMECHIRLCHADLDGLAAGTLLRLLPPDFDPRRLRLEVHGLTYTPPSPILLSTLEQLREAGLRLVLQVSDLNRLPLQALLRLRADWVKLNRRAFHGASCDPAKEEALLQLLKAIRGLGARAMAVGVEAWEDLELLKHLGVHHGQGPLWSHHP